VHQEREDADLDSGRGPRRRMPDAAIVRILARIEDTWSGESVRGLCQRGTSDFEAGKPPRRCAPGNWVVRRSSAVRCKRHFQRVLRPARARRQAKNAGPIVKIYLTTPKRKIADTNRQRRRWLPQRP